MIMRPTTNRFFEPLEFDRAANKWRAQPQALPTDAGGYTPQQTLGGAPRLEDPQSLSSSTYTQHASIPAFEVFGDLHAGLIADEDSHGTSRGLQSRGDVYRVAHSGVLVCIRAADPPEHNSTC